MSSGIRTSELDQLAAETCAYMSLTHPDYSTLAARIVINNLHKETKENFAEFIHDLFYHKDLEGKISAICLLLLLIFNSFMNRQEREVGVKRVI